MTPWNAEPYSNRVYEFIFAAANDIERGEGEGEVVLPGHLVLRPAPSLNRPKPVTAVNLGGTIYVLLYWHRGLPDYVKDCDSSFKRYDPISNSWITEASPPCYIELFKDTPCWTSPVQRHFVKDDKLFLYFYDDHRHRSTAPTASLDKPFATIYSSNGVPQYYQILDEVFSDMYPPGTMVITYTCPHLLDLGQVGQGNQIRICAVMTGDVQYLVTDDFYTGCPYISSKPNGHLFISMFDVEMLQLPTEMPRPLDVPPNSRQLLKVSTVKKLVFRLEKPLSFTLLNAFIL
ncbi:hypothetical protein RJT34_18803 [Clitoria ternatea]|uniref:Uncharacterized protein n=1 Tax=Clitoria ternatea TaxID=43366 RepID=A0AAN9JCU5_CLITE